MTTSASVLIQRDVHATRTTEAFSLLNAGLLAGSAVGAAVASSLLGPSGPRLTVLTAGAGPLLGGAALVAAVRASARRPTVPAGCVSR